MSKEFKKARWRRSPTLEMRVGFLDQVPCHYSDLFEEVGRGFAEGGAAPRYLTT